MLLDLPRRLASKGLWMGLVVATALFAPPTAKADFLLSYEVTTNEDIPDITDIVIYQAGDTGGSLTWPFSASGFGSTTLLENPFPVASVPPGAYLLGLVRSLPGDVEEGIEHVVLMMNNTAAAASLGLAFETIFPNTTEADLIDAIKKTTAGDNEGTNFLFTFSLNDAIAAHFPGQEPQSIYFNLGDSFTVVAFSDGTQIGTGQSFVTGQVIPEPSSVVLVLVGIGTCGLMAYRRKRRAG